MAVNLVQLFTANDIVASSGCDACCTEHAGNNSCSTSLWNNWGVTTGHCVDSNISFVRLFSLVVVVVLTLCNVADDRSLTFVSWGVYCSEEVNRSFSILLIVTDIDASFGNNTVVKLLTGLVCSVVKNSAALYVADTSRKNITDNNVLKNAVTSALELDTIANSIASLSVTFSAQVLPPLS